jgi:hypothetical protein
MRRAFDPPPPRARLVNLVVHELVRDYPELLSVLTESGISLRKEGASTLPPALFERAGHDRLTTTLAWRSRAGP